LLDKGYRGRKAGDTLSRTTHGGCATRHMRQDKDRSWKMAGDTVAPTRLLCLFPHDAETEFVRRWGCGEVIKCTARPMRQ